MKRIPGFSVSSIATMLDENLGRLVMSLIKQKTDVEYSLITKVVIGILEGKLCTAQ